MKVYSLFLALVCVLVAVIANEAEVGADGTVSSDSACDCTSQVAEAVSALANEKDGLLAELNASREQANAKIAELESVQQQLAAATQAVQEANQSAEQAKAAAAQEIETAKASMKALEEKAAAAEAAAAETEKEAEALRSSWVLVNMALVKADFKAFVARFGLEL